MSGSIIYDEDGADAGSIGFARDIRRWSSANSSLPAGEIAVSLAHEIYNPLETITNNSTCWPAAWSASLRDAELVVEPSGSIRSVPASGGCRRSFAGSTK